MAEANCTPCTSGGNSRKTISDVCRDLGEMQEEQLRLWKQMKNFPLDLSALLDLHKRLGEQVAILTELCPVQRPTEPCDRSTEEPQAVAHAQSQAMPTAPYPQFNAGLRLTNTSELLEMILLELPMETLLFAQRTSRQFRAVIVKSHPLQQRLFLTTLSATSASENIVLNPIITKKEILKRIPLYFDKNSMTMAYCPGKTRRRVCCTDASVGKDKTTGEEWIYLQLVGFRRSQPDSFGAGSWKEMCFSQPLWGFKWHLKMEHETRIYREHRYSGTFASASTMDAFLEAFATSMVVDEGEHLVHSPDHGMDNVALQKSVAGIPDL